MKKNFADHLKTLRKAAGLTQAELAQKIGISQQTIADYEKGRTTPDVKKIPDIAKHLGVSVSDLFGLSEEDDAVNDKMIHGNSRVAQIQELFEKLPTNDQRTVLKFVKGLMK